MQEKCCPTNQLQSIENTQSFIPLAHGQRTLWHLYQMVPKSTALNIYCKVEFGSDLNQTSWHRAWQKIGERHSILRTTYTSREGQPVQVVDPHREVKLDVTDASNWSEDYLKTQILATADRPFDLEKGSVLRVQLYTRHDKTSVQVLVMHHIAGDMWSFDILLEELQLLYTTEMEVLEGDSPKGNDVINKINPLPWQYTDYVIWQQKTLESAKGKQLWAYWKQELAGELPVLNLPTDRRRPPVQTYGGNSQFIELDEALLSKLRDVGKFEGASLYTLLLAAFLVQLYRYTNQEDILVGSAMAGRSAHQEFKKIVGYFSDPVVLRANLSGNPTFKEFVAQIRGTVFRALRHQDYPFPLLVEQLDANRDLSRPPLFQVAFTWQKHRWYETAPNCSGEGGKELSMKPYSSGLQRGSVLDLNLQIEEAGSSLVANWQYNTDLFDAATVSRMAGHFQTLLEAIVANPEQRVAQLPLLTEAERNQLLVEWNNTRTEYPQDKCIHQLFEEQVERTPDHVAVVFEDQKLTYRELNAKANQLAHYLQKLGVGPEVLVGICVERSLLMLIGLLGILKAGGAYVPLDPKYPKERIAFMLEDAQVSVLLTQQTLFETLPQHSAQVVYLDADEFAAGEGVDNLTSEPKSTNLAYVLYTSGSTGKPKGVAIEHRSTVALLSWATAVFSREQLAGVLASTSFCFDISVFELFVPLCCGGKVILAENALHLSSLPAADEVTLINTVPSAIAELVRAKGIPDGVRTVNLAGEALPQRVVELLYQQETIQEVFNLYGPSEDTVYSTYALVKRNGQKAPPIGCPIANTQIYILDAYQQPVPIGVPGELHLGGAGLARGYLNSPEVTQEKFISNPFNHEPGVRLYKTGDLVRYLPDGNIEFLGRSDHQVKIRGFRIELGEIEAVLSQHPSVQETVVIAREDVPGNKRLVAYVVFKLALSCTTGELRSFLKEKLSDYMIPGAFVLLEALPLLPNGKVDRRALPAPDPLRPDKSVPFVAPRTPFEEVLVGIWAEVLRLERVGVCDNFFELGGHSLLATQAISRIREAFQVELPLCAFFEKPTLAGLAKSVEGAIQTELGSSQALPIIPISRDGNLTLSFAQQRMWFFEQFMSGTPTYNLPKAIRLKGSLNMRVLEQSLGEIVRRHEALRTTFTAVNGQPIQVIHSPHTMQLPVVDLRELPDNEREAEAQRLATEEAQHSFALDQRPLWCIKLLRLSEEEHLLLLILHHIVFDAWSVGVFMRELATLYEAFSSEKSSPLPELPIQYVDFAAWQREWLQGEVLESQLNYWKQQLTGQLPVLELPTDRPRPPVPTFRGSRHTLKLPLDLTKALKAISQQESVTLFMTLLTAFKTLLYRHTGQEDILVGSPVANRSRVEIEGLIGCFTNAVAMRTNLGDNPSFRELLARVREVVVGAYTHQDLPFDILVAELQSERDLSRSPLFQVMFAIQNAPMPAYEFSNLTWSSLDVDNKTAKLDLSLCIVDSNQGLIGLLDYNTDLFDDATIARMMSHFQVLLESIVADPNQCLSELSILTEAERHQLLVEWNDTQIDYPLDVCTHQLFETQVERTPEADAVAFEDQQLTYRELNCRANQLAHYLQRLGVGPEVLVGICVERSLEMVVGVLGILKAGGAYVPLDPEYPKERLTFMLKDTQTSLILTQRHLAEGIPEHAAKVLCLDADWKIINQESQENPISKVKAENLAYVIYTSGSTGMPKGALLCHKGLCNRLLWGKDAFKLTGKDRLIQRASFSFDVSVAEILTPLLAGSCLVMPRPGHHNDIAHLLELIAKRKITLISLPPSILPVFLEEKVLEACQSLRLVFCSGESLTSELQERLFSRLGVEIRHNYGPTEATISMLAWVCQQESSRPVIPIGRPIANTQIYVLDSHQQPVCVGIPGELYISGVCLARGYLNQPELTAEKFIPNPFSDKPGSRLYKTGDLTRYLPDGNVEFLGRLDHQVKIRGMRIELGEIEAILGQHPTVRETVVIIREDVPGDKRLVAYVVFAQEQTATLSELRDFLKHKLPNYMVPSTIMLVSALPLTPNGKVDRHALPIPDHERPDLKVTFVAPRTPVEEVLAEIWAKVLRIERVGVHDNFFELGGHSLLTVQLSSRLRNTFQVELPLRYFFEAPTVTKLSQVIIANEAKPGQTEKIARIFKRVKAMSNEDVRNILQKRV